MDIAEKIKKKVEIEAISSQLSPARTISLYAREVFKYELIKYYICYYIFLFISSTLIYYFFITVF